jgi:predicted alpha/beta-fold hydrolase
MFEATIPGGQLPPPPGFLPSPPPCRAPWWARGAHAQTLFGHWLASRVPELPWESLTVKLADGDALRIRLARGRSGRTVTLFHGLGGSADRDYMLRAAARFFAAGDTVIAVNHRGAGDGRGLARRPYHSGATLDLAAVFQVVRGLFPDHWNLAIGYSLSGNILLLLLGQDTQERFGRPDAAIAVNPPVDLDHCSRLLEKGLNRLYDLRFVRLLRKDLQHRWELGLLDDPVRIPALATLRDFDELYTARAAGFWDRSQYYARCACGPHLGRIRVPTVIITAEDDPLAPAADLLKHPRSAAIHLHVEPRGGHMGYLSRDHADHRWLEPTLLHFANALQNRHELEG